MYSEKLVSVIVPVYNAESYLTGCIESIITQSYKNIELILVNDESTDKSGVLCDEYASKDSRIKVIHQENSGPSIARNRGIEAATGDYIQFVDADDHIDRHMTEKLVNAMDLNQQLVICGYKKILKKDGRIINTKTFQINQTGEFKKEEFLMYFGELYRHYYLHFSWNKLYSAAIIKNAELCFPTEVNWGEDLLFNLHYLEQCERIYVLPDPFYYYIDSNNNSITSQFRKDFFVNMQMVQEAAREFLRRHNAYKGTNKELFEQFYTSRIVTCFWNLFHPNSALPPELVKQYICEILQDEQVNQSIDYFKKGNFDKKLTGKMIEGKYINALYNYFCVKSFFKKRMEPDVKKWV